MKIKFCPRLLIFEPLDCTLGIFRGYDFSIFQILLFLDGYFGVFLFRPSSQPLVCLVMECPWSFKAREHILATERSEGASYALEPY